MQEKTKDKTCYQLKFLNTKNIINIKKYLILFFYVYICQNDYYNNLYRKKIKNPNNTRLISPIRSDSIAIFSSKNLNVSIRMTCFQYKYYKSDAWYMGNKHLDQSSSQMHINSQIPFLRHLSTILQERRPGKAISPPYNNLGGQTFIPC